MVANEVKLLENRMKVARWNGRDFHLAPLSILGGADCNHALFPLSYDISEITE